MMRGAKIFIIVLMTLALGTQVFPKDRSILRIDNDPELGKYLECPAFPIQMNYSLAWTHYQIHRVTDNSSLEINLSGNICCNAALFWNLNTIYPQPNGMPKLYFIESIFGGQNYYSQNDIPLNFQISIDNGPFQPVTITPQNTLSILFPPGPHTFTLRFTGMLPYHAADGYYSLQLAQCLIPQL